MLLCIVPHIRHDILILDVATWTSRNAINIMDYLSAGIANILTHLHAIQSHDTVWHAVLQFGHCARPFCLHFSTLHGCFCIAYTRLTSTPGNIIALSLLPDIAA